MSLAAQDRGRGLEMMTEELWRSRLFSYAFKVSEQSWLPFQHVRYLSDKIEAAVAKPGGRLIVMMPPQTGKSQLTSVWLPIWYLDNWPEKRILLASYSADKAAEWSGKARDTFMTSPLISSNIGGTQRADRWTTERGGYLAATSVGGQMTGWSGDLIVIDDPVKDWAEAESPTIRKKHKMWYESVVDTRVQEDSTIMLCMTRWHEDDLAGYLMASDPRYEVVRLPALAETADDPLGRKVGETICAERFTTEYYEAKRDRTPDLVWSGLYQQRPNVEGGTVFKRDYFNERYTSIPTSATKWYQSWDFDFGSQSADSSYCVGTVWACTEGKAFLVDVIRERFDFDEMCDAIRRTTQRFPRAYTKIIENKAAGPLIKQRLFNEIDGIEMYEPGKNSKTERAMAASKALKYDVVIPEAGMYHWVDTFVDEFLMFPNGSFDDQVDSATQFINFWKNTTFDWW